MNDKRLRAKISTARGGVDETKILTRRIPFVFVGNHVTTISTVVMTPIEPGSRFHAVNYPRMQQLS